MAAGQRMLLFAVAAVATTVITASRFAVRPRNQSCLELSRLYSSYQKGDISEAEYREKTVLNRRDPKEQREPDSDWTTGIKRIGNGVKSFFGRIGNGALKLIGQDKESREKRELSRVVYAEFDKIFEGTDVFGGLITGLFMQGWFGELMTKMMHEATDQFDRIENKAIAQLESEPACVSALGTNISLGKPYFATSSTKNIYGLFTKQVLYRCTASGSSGQGQVQIRASLDKDDSVTMLEVILRTDEGDVVVRDVAALGEGKSNAEEGKTRIVDTEEVM